MPVEDYLPEWEDIWEEVGRNRLSFFLRLRDRGMIDQETFAYEMDLIFPPPPDLLAFKMPTPADAEMQREAASRGVPIETVRGEYGIKADVYQALMEKERGYLSNAFYEVIKSLWKWTLEQLKSLLNLVVSFAEVAWTAVWEKVETIVEETTRILFKGIFAAFEDSVPIKPDDAKVIAGKLYTFAIKSGLGAHATALAGELFHPLKSMGMGQIPGMIGQFAGFGRISGACLGPLMSRVLGQAMTYSVQNQYRPVIPRESLLIEMRSKREIDKPRFDEAMAHQGFSDDWIDAIERWQWKDPRMFELMRVADIGIDQGPMPSGEAWWFRKFGQPGIPDSDWWLQRKLMRAGYEDVDIPVLIRTIHRREISFAMTYVRTAIRRNYRWGFLDDEELTKWIDRLKLPEQAKQWISDAGRLDREYFYKQDLVGYYKTAFRQDVIDDDDLLVSLVAMGLPAREADIIVRTEKVRKKPTVTRKVAAEVKKPLSDIQKKHVTLYREQYRKQLISESQYLESLLAIGLAPELAEVSVAIETAKKGVPIAG